MKNDALTISWTSFVIALLSVIGVFLMPEMQYWFFTLLILNIMVAFVVRHYYTPLQLNLSRILVGLLFIFSGFMKGIDPLGTKYKMLDYLEVYGMEWLNDFAFIMAIVLISAEFIVGFCLVLRILPRMAVLGATLLMIFFTFTTMFDAFFNLVPDCGCFGEAIKMSNWQTFFKNIIIDTILIFLIFNNKVLKNIKLKMNIQWIIAFVVVFLFIGFQIRNYYYLPAIDMLKWKEGSVLNKEPEPTKVYLTYKNTTTGETKEYLSPNYPWDDQQWMSEWEFVSQRTEGGGNYIGFSAVDIDGNDVTDMLLNSQNVFLFVSPYLDKVTEKEFQRCLLIQDSLVNAGFDFVWVTASDEETIENLRNKALIDGDIFFGDDLELKTIVRSNPGIILLDDGKVIKKWSRIQIPQGKKITQLLEKINH